MDEKITLVAGKIKESKVSGLPLNRDPDLMTRFVFKHKELIFFAIDI